MAEYIENCEIVEKTHLTKDLYTLKIRPLEGEIPLYTPGQYGELALPSKIPHLNGKMVRRQYSIASAPGDKTGIEFFIVCVETGTFTPTLTNLKVGDLIWMNPKTKGHFTLDPVPAEKNILMISTGTGLAPFISMVREYQDKNRWNKVSILNGVRLSEDLGYRTELETLHESNPNFRYIPIVSREQWSGKTGRVQHILEDADRAALLGFDLDPEHTQILLCGNPEMIDTSVAYLEGLNFKQHSKKEPGNIHFERYW
jgi:ferredoxin/flavodoxin---NADP+ reductase